MKYIINVMVMIAMACSAYARDESYVPDGFIGQSASLLDDGIAIVTVEVIKWDGPEKSIGVKILAVLHGTNTLLEATRIYDDGFDPIFNEQFKVGSKWILRIQPRTVDRQKQWVVSYYETSHLELVKDHVEGSIAKHNEKKKMKYSDFKTLLTKEIAKNKPNDMGESDGK